MKIILYLNLILLVSCQNDISTEYSTQKREVEVNKIEHLEIGEEIEKEIQEDLTLKVINYYKHLYSNGLKVTERKEKEGVILIFSNISSKNNLENSWAWSIYVPQNVILGDLNKDDIQDAIVDVNKAGGGIGGNFEENELIYFENSKGKFEIKEVIASKKLCNCENGSFLPERIENNLLLGTSMCYKESDPMCCPSISFLTKLSFKDNNLIIENDKNK